MTVKDIDLQRSTAHRCRRDALRRRRRRLRRVAHRLGRGGGPGRIGRRRLDAPRRARAVRPQAGQSAVAGEIVPRGPRVELRVPLPPPAGRRSQPLGASLGPRSRGLLDIGGRAQRGGEGGWPGQRRRRQRPLQLRAARRHRAGQQAAQAASPVRRGGPRARQGHPAVQPGGRGRRLPALPVGRPCRLALRDCAAGACRRSATTAGAPSFSSWWPDSVGRPSVGRGPGSLELADGRDPAVMGARG